MKIHCSGIGGIGLSAYAALQALEGHTVSGSDRKDSPLLQGLREMGMQIDVQQEGALINADTDLLVYSEAIPKDAPERAKAAELGIPMQSYFQALGEISKGKTVIAVCGTHGKSSTTAMAARLLIEAGMDPTVVVGTKVRELDGRNWHKGKSAYFVLEACEYRRSFQYLSPSIILLTNADGDHFDAYKDVAEYQQAFVEFLQLLPADGAVITHMNDADCARIAKQSGRSIIDADSQPLPRLATPGLHMRQNGQLALALGQLLGIPQQKALSILSGFSGTWRRMEVKGERNGITIIDDYAHHPKEIRATLAALREAYPDRRLICAFQPHTHDRTRKLYDEFLGAFTDSDLVVVADVYNARSDIETGMVDAKAFSEDIARVSQKEVMYGGNLKQVEELLRAKIMRSGDVVVCMGAGDITEVAGRLITGT